MKKQPQISNLFRFECTLHVYVFCLYRAMADNNCAKVSLIACMVLVWAVMIAVNTLSTIKAGRDIGRYYFTIILIELMYSISFSCLLIGQEEHCYLFVFDRFITR